MSCDTYKKWSIFSLEVSIDVGLRANANIPVALFDCKTLEDLYCQLFVHVLLERIKVENKIQTIKMQEHCYVERRKNTMKFNCVFSCFLIVVLINWPASSCTIITKNHCDVKNETFCCYVTNLTANCKLQLPEKSNRSRFQLSNMFEQLHENESKLRKISIVLNNTDLDGYDHWDLHVSQLELFQGTLKEFKFNLSHSSRLGVGMYKDSMVCPRNC